MNYPTYLVHFNKNHDPKTGRFTFSKIGDKILDVISPSPKIKNVDVKEEVSKKLAEKNAGIIPKEAATFKTKELDSDYDEIKDIVPRHKDLPKLDYNSNDASQWPKDYVKAVDAGLKAIEKSKYGNGEFDDEPKNASREWFVFEDQTIGYPEVAYLLSKGKSIDEIKGIANKAKKIEEVNNAYLNQYSSYQERANHYKDQPYPTFDGVFSMIDYFSYQGGDESYEKEVINVLKDEGIIHGDFYMSNYLIHYNKNHSKTNGQFVSGDGDGDGISNDHKNQKNWRKEKTNSNADSDTLARVMSKYADSYADYLNNSKTRFFTENGAPLKKADGSVASMFIYNTKKEKKWKEETEKYLYVKGIMQRKYKDVVAKADLTDAGESFVNIVLTDRRNNVYTTTMRKTYDADFNRYEYKEAFK